MRRSIKQEFPEFPVYRMHHEPIGPHPIGMFEVDIANPAQFGALVPWLAIHHGPLSILIHPHTGDSRRDHSQNAIWIGKRLSIDLSIFDRFSTKEELAMKLQQLGGVQDLLENRS